MPDVLVTHTLSSAATAVPNPGPSTPPPVKPVVAGDSGRPFGANADRLPSQSASRACEPTMKLTPVQTFPWLSNISFPGPLSPPPVNLSGRIQALGAALR